MDYNRIIDKYYPAGTRLRDIYLRHCRSVASKALEISHSLNLNVDDSDVEAAAMLHDIGIFMTDAPGIDCRGDSPYLAHGKLGADLLRKEGVPEPIARVAERHTGAGITPDEIGQFNLPLPPGDYMPHTLLERLVCYADKFFSKSGDMKEKSIEKVRDSMLRLSAGSLERFNRLHDEFGQFF